MTSPLTVTTIRSKLTAEAIESGEVIHLTYTVVRLILNEAWRHAITGINALITGINALIIDRRGGWRWRRTQLT